MKNIFISLSLFFFCILSQNTYSSISLNATIVNATDCPFIPSCLNITWFTKLNSTSIFLTSPITATYTVILNNTINNSINSGSVSYCYPFVSGTNFTFIMVDDSTGITCANVSVTTIQFNVACPALPTKVMLDPYLSDEIAMVHVDNNIYLYSAGSANLQQKFNFYSGTRLASNNLVIRGSKSMILYGQSLIIPSRTANSQGFIFQLDMNLNQIQKVPYIAPNTVPTVVVMGFNSTILYAGYNDGILRFFDFSQYPAMNFRNVSAHGGDFGSVLSAPGFLLTCGASDSMVKKWSLNGTLLLSFGVVGGCQTAILTPSYEYVIVGTSRLLKYNITTGALVLSMYDPLLTSPISTFATLANVFSMNITENFVFLAGLDNVIRQWDYTTGVLTCRYYGGFTFRQILINGSYILGLSSGQVAQYWIQKTVCFDLIASNPNLVYQKKIPGVLRVSSLTPDGNGFFFNGYNGVVTMYNPSSGVVSFSVTPIGASGPSNAICVNGSIVFIGFAQFPFIISGLNIANGATIVSLSGHTAIIWNILVVKGKLVSAQANLIKTWDPNSWLNTLNITNSGNNIGSIDTDSNLVYYQMPNKNIGILDPVLKSISILPCSVSSFSFVLAMKYSATYNYLIMTFGGTYSAQSFGYCNINSGNFVNGGSSLYANQINTKVGIENKFVVFKDLVFLPFLDGSIQIHNISLIPRSTFVRQWYAATDTITTMTYFNGSLYIGTDNGMVLSWNFPEFNLNSQVQSVFEPVSSTLKNQISSMSVATNIIPQTTAPSIILFRNSTSDLNTLVALITTVILIVIGVIIGLTLYYFRFQMSMKLKSNAVRPINSALIFDQATFNPETNTYILKSPQTKIYPETNTYMLPNMEQPNLGNENVIISNNSYTMEQNNYYNYPYQNEIASIPNNQAEFPNFGRNDIARPDTSLLNPVHPHLRNPIHPHLRNPIHPHLRKSSQQDDITHQINNNVEFPGYIETETLSSIYTSNSNSKTVTMGGETLMDHDTVGILSLPGYLSIQTVDYKCTEQIGKGGMGEIYFVDIFDKKAVDRAGKNAVVAKVMISGGMAVFKQEVSIMGLFVNQIHFAKLIAFDNLRATLLMSYYPEGSIDNWIIKNSKLQDIFTLIHGVFDAINCLTKCGIVHNDIKPANVLVDVNEDGTVCAKLTDFGIANIIDKTKLLVSAFQVHNVKGMSIMYASPERLDQNYQNMVDKYQLHDIMKSGDIYSMGIVICEMLTKNKFWWIPFA